MIRHLITGGCSFSNGFDVNGWTAALSRHLRSVNPELTTMHTGRPSSGNDLIQKRVSIALLEALEQGIKPEEILVAVMWSGTSRKSWYIDNQGFILKMVEQWAEFEGGMSNQFVNMRGDLGEVLTGQFHTANGSLFNYNPNGGWYISVNGSDTKLKFIVDHYNIDSEINGPGKTHESLQNMIMLQNLCRLHQVKLINQFFMDHVYTDIERHRDHEIINYLYKQFDHDNSIKTGLFEYVHDFINVARDEAYLLTHDERRQLSNATGKDYFAQDGFHPGETGYLLWFENHLRPFLISKSIV